MGEGGISLVAARGQDGGHEDVDSDRSVFFYLFNGPSVYLIIFQDDKFVEHIVWYTIVFVISFSDDKNKNAMCFVFS